MPVKTDDELRTERLGEPFEHGERRCRPTGLKAGHGRLRHARPFCQLPLTPSVFLPECTNRLAKFEGVTGSRIRLGGAGFTHALVAKLPPVRPFTHLLHLRHPFR